jgi:hypothetical protein
MNALESPHELLEGKWPPVFAHGDNLGVEDKRLTLQIYACNLNDFRQA